MPDATPPFRLGPPLRAMARACAMGITAELRGDKETAPEFLYRQPERGYKRRMDFRILGPLQVLDGDAEVQLGSPKERALLAVLLLHAGTVVSRERLIDELWGDSPPPTAAKALNVHVSQLRKSLARNGQDPIATHAPGYALRIEPERLDAARFERLVAEARGHAASGDARSASELFRAALAVWRGPALAGIELESAARSEAGRLDGLRLAALMDKLDCDLALGLHEQVIGELEGLVAEHPLHERLRGQYMLALYRAGRQADALRAYQQARETLVGELGLEPSSALHRLERGILNHDPALELPAGIPPPSRVDPVQPRGTPRGHFVAGAALAALALAVGLAVVLALRDGNQLHVTANHVAALDPRTAKVTAVVPVGLHPNRDRGRRKPRLRRERRGRSRVGARRTNPPTDTLDTSWWNRDRTLRCRPLSVGG
jgi:DNA-binding SARP family transcriptional activator